MEEILKRLKDLKSWSDRLGSDELNEINNIIFLVDKEIKKSNK